MFSHLEPQFQAFRATIFSLDVQSHPILVQESKATSFSIYAFRATILGIQSHHFSLGVQSHSFQFKRLEPLFSVQAFRATIFFQFRGSKPPYFSLGIQSHLFWLRRSEPSFSIQSFRATVLGVQSHFLFFIIIYLFIYLFSVQAFIAIVLSIQSHSPFVQAFRATFFNFRCLESQF